VRLQSYNIGDDSGCDIVLCVFGAPRDDWRLRPGDWASHADRGGLGFIVASCDGWVTVLWSEAPRPEKMIDWIVRQARRKLDAEVSVKC
jgi:hypothetical protein